MTQDQKAIIDQFVKDLEYIFQDSLLDIVLYGSIIRGDFHPNKSDIDFIVFKKGFFSQTQIQEIQNLHRKYRSNTGLERLLEGRYIGLKDLKMMNGYYVGTKENGWKEITDFGFDHLEKAMILDSFLAIYNHVLLEDLFSYTWPKVQEEIRHQIKSFISSPHIGDAAFEEYALTTAARSLYTYQMKGFLSKENALQWVEDTYFPLDFDDCIKSIYKIKEIMDKIQ